MVIGCGCAGCTLIDVHLKGSLTLYAHLPPCRYGPSADPFYYGEGVLSYTDAYFYNYDRKMIVRYTEGGVGTTWNVAILANGQNYTFVSALVLGHFDMLPAGLLVRDAQECLCSLAMPHLSLLPLLPPVPVHPYTQPNTKIAFKHAGSSADGYLATLQMCVGDDYSSCCESHLLRCNRLFSAASWPCLQHKGLKTTGCCPVRFLSYCLSATADVCAGPPDTELLAITVVSNCAVMWPSSPDALPDVFTISAPAVGPNACLEACMAAECGNLPAEPYGANSRIAIVNPSCPATPTDAQKWTALGEGCAAFLMHCLRSAVARCFAGWLPCRAAQLASAVDEWK